MRKAAIPNWIAYHWAKALRLARPAAPRYKVGIYTNGRLGDFVLAVGAIRRICAEAGADNCVLYHSRYAAEVVAREFPELAAWELPELHGQLWRTQRCLDDARRNRAIPAVEQLLCLRHYRSLMDDLALMGIPSRVTTALSNSPRAPGRDELVRVRWPAEARARPAKWSADECEELACHRALLEAWHPGMVPGDLRPTLRASVAVQEKILRVSPFGSSPLRDIRRSVLAGAARAAHDRFGLQVELLAPPADVLRYQRLAAEVASDANAPVQVRATANISELIAALAGAAAVLTAETATAHLAAALDRPMVCVIGGGHFGMFAPWSRSARQKWIAHRLPCYDCDWSCIHRDAICITDIGAAQVVDALANVLALKPEV